MKRGSLIIYDNTGRIWINTGDAEGDILPHTVPESLSCLITKFGELDNKIVKGVQVDTRKLITEDIPRIKTEEEKLREQLLETQEELVNIKYVGLTNINNLK